MEYVESIKRYLMMESINKERKHMNDMERFFIERTNKHISRVQDFIDTVCEFYPALANSLRRRGKLHDQSKFFIPERKYYIILTWRYKMQNEGKEYKINDKTNQGILDASFHHVKNNPHHPEYWDKHLTKNPINKDNRDKRDFIVDGTLMDELSMLEQVCDWSAMSIEHNETEGPKEWADNAINKKWKFTNQQSDFIYEAIDLLWS